MSLSQTIKFHARYIHRKFPYLEFKDIFQDVCEQAIQLRNSWKKTDQSMDCEGFIKYYLDDRKKNILKFYARKAKAQKIISDYFHEELKEDPCLITPRHLLQKVQKKINELNSNCQASSVFFDLLGLDEMCEMDNIKLIKPSTYSMNKQSIKSLCREELDE
jgi:hypothetical protein